jgi:hypothetical protein
VAAAHLERQHDDETHEDDERQPAGPAAAVVVPGADEKREQQLAAEGDEDPLPVAVFDVRQQEVDPLADALLEVGAPLRAHGAAADGLV